MIIFWLDFVKELNFKVLPIHCTGKHHSSLLWREVKLITIHILPASAPLRCSPSLIRIWIHLQFSPYLYSFSSDYRSKRVPVSASISDEICLRWEQVFCEVIFTSTLKWSFLLITKTIQIFFIQNCHRTAWICRWTPSITSTTVMYPWQIYPAVYTSRGEIYISWIGYEINQLFLFVWVDKDRGGLGSPEAS